MKGLGRKASFLAIVAVLATAVMGSAYSLWFEELSATTNITTSHLDAKIGCIKPVDNEMPVPNWQTGGWFDLYPNASPLKDVADTIVLTQPNSHLMELQVSNAYPGYAWDCEIHITNPSPLPWHIEDFVIKVLECDSTGIICNPITPPPAPAPPWAMTCTQYTCSWGSLGISPPNFPNGLAAWSPFNVVIPNWRGCQVHDTDLLGPFNGGSLLFGVNQSAKENTKYKIQIEYQVNQWNESSYDGCGHMKPGYSGPVLSQLQ